MCTRFSRLLRKPGKLISAQQLPEDEREEMECEFNVRFRLINVFDIYAESIMI